MHDDAFNAHFNDIKFSGVKNPPFKGYLKYLKNPYSIYVSSIF